LYSFSKKILGKLWLLIFYMKKKCSGCGVCCQLFLINLNKKEYESGFYKTMFGNFKITDTFRQAQKYGANILAQNEDGSCVYLKNNSCLIYLERPQVCRRFFCTSKSKRFKEMIRQIEEKSFGTFSKLSVNKLRI